MSSNTKTLTHFSEVPQAEIQRSTFDRSHGVKTTFDAGKLIPILVDEVLPGDTHKLRPHHFGRLATPIVPFMDNLYLDTHYFFVPTRLIWNNWEKFNGAQTDPDDSTDFIVPTMLSPTGGYDFLSIYDHFGIPPKIQQLEHTSLPLRAYNLIWNEWYRDENLQDSVLVHKGDTPDPASDYKILPRGKRKDYFTGSLPWPQKGPAVNLPLGTQAPVIGIGKRTATFNYNTNIAVRETGQTTTTTYPANDSVYIDPGADDRTFFIREDANNPGFPAIYADLEEATAATINSLRLAFQVQKMYERDARGGTRYVEILKAHFNVTSPDFRLQRPEYLGGHTSKIASTVVPQTAPTNDTTPQGNLAAYAMVSDSGNGFTHSFTEHGYIIGLVSLRADLNYQQGLNRLWSRKTRFDYYWPALSHLGEQAILNKEIYAQGNGVVDGTEIVDNQVFGYQERNAEYRYKPNEIHGAFRSNYTTPLDMWHLAQDFTSLPLLNASFIEENPPVDRVLAVETEPQVLLDIWHDFQSTRPMPVYAVPGLVDHF